MKNHLATLFIIALYTLPSSNLIASLQVQERVLWGTKKSPYVQKVLITLEEKEVPYTFKRTLPTVLLKATHQDVPESFSQISPLGKIPAYQEQYSDSSEAFSTSESAVIMDYLDATIPNNPLRSQTPQVDARISWFMAYGDYILAPITHKLLYEKAIKPTFLNEPTDTLLVNNLLENELPRILDFLETTLSDNRTWIANTPNFSLADITIISHLMTLSTIGIDLTGTITPNRPKLLTYTQKILSRPSVKRALAPTQKPQAN